MARFWNHWIGRSQHSKSKHPRRDKRRNPTQRRIKAEALEARQLMAANIFHNAGMPEDVDQDGVVAPIDALAIINQLNRQSRFNDAGSLDSARDGRHMTDVNNDGEETPQDALMVINRLNRQRRGEIDPTDRPDNSSDDPAEDVTTEYRTIDGTGNNLENPELGSAGSELLRVAENDYADGISEPAGEDRPSAREISNTVSDADPEGTFSERDLSSYVYLWGQFLDHDIDLSLTPEDEADAISFAVEVPADDALFDPFGTGEVTIPLTRSEVADGTGTSTDNPAEQVNSITSWIDGSQIYGSSQEVADSLRSFEGGRLLITDDGLLPTDEDGNIMAGDIRAAENLGLTAMQTLFLREHNRVADEISAADPDLSDEEIYQQARATVIAELQSITYNEFLPALLGEDALSDYEGYDSSVDASVANEYSTAAFRFGHSTLNDGFGFFDNDGLSAEDPISLADAFFNPSLLEDYGIDTLLKASASHLSQEIDLEVVDNLRNFLFGAPGSGGLDLVSLNIQRGRDHGLADFNSVRVAYGLDAYESFDQITSDAELAADLESLYGDINNIDLWVGLLAEDHAEDSSLGETATTIIADQFERLRDGDRFYYENTLTQSQIRQVENTTLSDIIEMNTNNTNLQSNIFFFSPTISGTVTSDTVATDTADSEALTAASFDASQNAENNRNNDRDRQRRDRDSDDDRDNNNGVEGITVELVDGAGNVIDSAVTDSDGNYELASISTSGLYEVRVAASDEYTTVGSETIEALVSSGDSHLKGLNFEITV
ncbi:peroxidase family protein [Roseimaritima ulvae]|uniref:Peroxidase n=1 Tax=Roseimaritima ulvae TaxID=980254 RepID=A0A5B9QVB4_9BACT|nr:peroxidase family protein [Roseimaritima ulvae]QEG41026.1 peroxidase [Roseimaritima ulvae]